MSSKKDVSSETDLEKILRESRANPVYKKEYKPDRQVIIDGVEVTNHRQSGFPKLADLRLVLEELVDQKFQPLAIVVDSTLQFLLEAEESQALVEALVPGFKIPGQLLTVRVFEVKDTETALKKMLKLALNNNARILSNQNLPQTYSTLTQKKLTTFEGKPWQMRYTISDEGTVSLTWDKA